MAKYTSRYSNKTLRDEGYYAVGISQGTPKFPLGYQIREKNTVLAPNWNMMKLDVEAFREEYFRKLNRFGRNNVINLVEEMNRRAEAEGKELVLLCFEDIRKEGQWCHRTMFAEWWLNETGERIEELSEPDTAVKKTTETSKADKEDGDDWHQMSIFELGM